MATSLILLWYAIGVASFIYWWTREFDLETDDICLMLAAGVFGPASFFIGWAIHGKPLLKKRTLLKKQS